jgi:hypothetical protein
LDKVDWDRLSMNPRAISILEKHPDRFEVRWTLINPNALHLACDLDYERMKEHRQSLKEELQAYYFHPDRIFQKAKQLDIDVRTCLQGM